MLEIIFTLIHLTSYFITRSFSFSFTDVQDGNKRLLLAPQQWLEDLQVPQDAYDLLYRLGQKTVQFDRMKVHTF